MEGLLGPFSVFWRFALETRTHLQPQSTLRDAFPARTSEFSHCYSSLSIVGAAFQTSMPFSLLFFFLRGGCPNPNRQTSLHKCLKLKSDFQFWTTLYLLKINNFKPLCVCDKTTSPFPYKCAYLAWLGSVSASAQCSRTLNLHLHHIRTTSLKMCLEPVMYSTLVDDWIRFKAGTSLSLFSIVLCYHSGVSGRCHCFACDLARKT